MKGKATVAVVGGGISGIAAAHFLVRKGFSVEIIESENDLGGRVGCDYIGDRKVEFGGKNIGRNYPLFREFVKDVGDFSYEFFGINTSTREGGKKRIIDSEKRYRTLKNLLSLVGFKDFMKVMRMAAAIRSNSDNGYLGGPYFSRLADKMDDKPITEYFGEKFNKNFVRPLTIRMNGAEPDTYFLGNFGSNLKMVLDRYDQLEHGVHQVIREFTKRISVRSNTRVTGLVAQNKRVMGLLTESGERVQTLWYDAVVLATPAPAAADIVRQSHAKIADLLGRVRYNPVAIAVAKYGEPVFANDSRAQVFGPAYALSNAGAYGINDLDMVRYTFSGACAANRIHARSDPEEVLDLGERSLGEYQAVPVDKREGFVYRYFKTGLCAYSPHHNLLLMSLHNNLDQMQGLALAGDYLRGAAIEACFRSGLEAAERIARQVDVASTLDGAV